MDIPTLALAKAYTDSQRLAHIEYGAVVYDGALEDNGDGTTGVEVAALAEMVAGKTYSVKLDSGTYYGVCQTVDEVNVVGNLGLMGGVNTGESYLLGTVFNGVDAIAFLAIDQNRGTHCTVTEVEFHKIAPEFLHGLFVSVVDIADLTALTDEEKMAINSCVLKPFWLRTPGFVMLMNSSADFSGASPVYMWSGQIGASSYNIFSDGASNVTITKGA